MICFNVYKLVKPADKFGAFVLRCPLPPLNVVNIRQRVNKQTLGGEKKGGKGQTKGRPREQKKRGRKIFGQKKGKKETLETGDGWKFGR